MSDELTGRLDEAGVQETAEFVDPRRLLADWANENEEWLRLLVSEVIATGLPADVSTIDKAYQLLRQENDLDERTLAAADSGTQPGPATFAQELHRAGCP